MMQRINKGWLGALFASLTLPLAGCGSDDSEAPGHTGCENSLTSYPGDCLRSEALTPEQGLSLHYGPSAYTKDAMAPYLIGPGEEFVDVLYTKSTNEQQIYFNAVTIKLRPGGHHMIVSHSDRDLTEGLFPAELPPFDFDILIGSQSDGLDSINGPASAPGDEQLAFTLGPRQQMALNAHFLNTSDKTMLREVWINFYAIDPAKVTGVLGPLWLVGGFGMAVPPRTKQIISESAVAPHDLRIMYLAGHFHTHTRRFSAYIKRQSAPDPELVYETYDYRDIAYVRYDAVTQSPVPDREHKISGGTSGVLEMKAGDTLAWECEIDNNEDFVMKFANQLDTAEMCALFGAYTPAENGSSWRAFLP